MKRMKVIVVHPDSGTGERIAETIRSAGHEPVLVPDGERAIDRFIQDPADALIVEMVLPGRDGGTTVESIRWAPGGDAAAVILLGTRGTTPDRLDEVGRRVGALASLAGPVSIPALGSLLAGLAGPHTDSTRVANSEDLQQRLLATTREHLPLPPTATTSQGFRAFGETNDWDEELYTDVDEEMSGHWRVGDDPGAEREGREVEAQARAVELGQTEDALRGDLSRTAFPRLLHRLAERRANGALVVVDQHDRRRTTTGESVKKVVYFRMGVPVYVRSNLVQECLGQVLARGGHISQKVLDESIRRMRNGDGRQGAVLVAMGELTPHELREALEDQLRVKIFDLFAWDTGTFEFDEDARPPAETVTLEMSLANIVLKGVVHRVPPQKLLERLQPYLEQFVVPSPSRLEQFRAVEMAPVAKRILMSLDGMQKLESLLGSAGDRPGATAQLVYALACVDAVTFRDEAYPTPRLRERRADTPPTKDLATLREELTRLGRLLREERYEEALAVEGGDVTEALQRSERLAARFRRVTEPGAAPRELRALAYEVCARLVHAQKALGQRGSQVGTSVERRTLGEVEADALAEEQADAFGEIPTRDETPGGAEVRPTRPWDRSEVKSRVEMTQRAKRRVDAPVDAARDAPADDYDDLTVDEGADEVPTPRISEPPGPLVSQSGPISVEASMDSASASRRLDREVSGEVPSAALDERVDRMFRAERHFRRGEKALLKRRPEEARTAFEKSVRLCPDEAEFVAHLGYARYQAAGGDERETERATQELERACALAPKLDICHLLLARVLEDQGRPSDARNAYEQALAANPDCTEALEGLRSLNPPAPS